MAPVAPKSLFPLPLTAFEQFMLVDESTEFPMLFYLQVRLRGVVDQAIMKLAVDTALSRHPLLCSRVEVHSGKDCWVWAGEEIPDTDWNHAKWSAEEPWRKPIDLRKTVGLRAWGEQTEDLATITLQFHHACCDGIGAAGFLEDIAVAYARHFATQNGHNESLPELRPVDLELLKHRNSREGRRIADIRGSIIRRTRVLLKYTARYLQQEKVPLLTRPFNSSDQQQGLGLMTMQLNRQETRGLRDAAKRHSASLNDLLVSELMVTSQAWNTQHGQRERKPFSWKQPTICVLVPTSLRGPSDMELPACNVVSYAFMARPTSLATKRLELLCSIRDEMQLVHKHQAGWLFVQAIEAMNKIPGMLRFIMWRTQGRCMSTTVLSHMGNLLNTIRSRLPRRGSDIQMGNLLVEHICGIPPIRQGTAAAVSTMMLNGCLSISMRCCPKRFSQQEATELLNAFANTLKQTAHQENLMAATSDDSAQVPEPGKTNGHI